jgi:uncharacterized protein YeaO (DUF488 family)
MPIRIKRVYDEAEAQDGARILVDRLWPRGMSKDKAAFAEWMKELAPTTALRQWFDHKPERWAEFQARYREELRENPLVAPLRQRAKVETVTLLYGSRNRDFNHARVLADYLLET